MPNISHDSSRGDLSLKPQLIYDIGMHNGDDTAYYLQQGFDVVAVEANQVLAKQASDRFRDAIATGRLRVLNCGIAERSGVSTFWVNRDRDEWSSFIKAVGCRDGTRCETVQVQCRRLRDILAEHGVPYYMKIDIEGNDIYALRDLDRYTVPPYLSVEAHRLEYLCILSELGYDRFKCIDQTNHNLPTSVNNETLLSMRKVRDAVRGWLEVHPKVLRRLSALRRAAAVRPNAGPATGPSSWVFPMGSSGGFGEHTRGDWQSLEAIAYNWLHFKLGKQNRGTLNMRGWYDFHAKRSEAGAPTG